MNSMEILSKMLLVMNVQSDPYKYEFVSCDILARHTNSLDAFHRLANLIVLKSQNSSECRDETTEEEDRNSKYGEQFPVEVIISFGYGLRSCLELSDVHRNRDIPDFEQKQLETSLRSRVHLGGVA